MKYCIVIDSSPSQAASRHALKFCEALDNQGHTIHRIFFFGNGVLHALKVNEEAFDWRQFTKTEKLYCSASAESLLPKNLDLISKRFSLAGLGQLVEAEQLCDRIVNFGSGS